MLSAALKAFSRGARCTSNPIRTSLTFAAGFFFFRNKYDDFSPSFRSFPPSANAQLRDASQTGLFFNLRNFFLSSPLNSVFSCFSIFSRLESIFLKFRSEFEFISFARGEKKIENFSVSMNFRNGFYSLATLMAADFVVSMKFNGQFSWLESEGGEVGEWTECK